VNQEEKRGTKELKWS